MGSRCDAGAAPATVTEQNRIITPLCSTHGKAIRQDGTSARKPGHQPEHLALTLGGRGAGRRATRVPLHIP